MPDYRDMTVDELRNDARRRGIPHGWDMTKDELIRALKGPGDTEPDAEGSPRRVEGDHKYEQEVRSPDEDPEREGRSLITTSHEVIRSWAEERKATPATVPGTEHGDHLGVLRFDFPGYGGQELRHVSWDDWFKTFDERRLNFIYQETKADGTQSNFFRLDSPDREDG